MKSPTRKRSEEGKVPRLSCEIALEADNAIDTGYSPE
jgi:hypothetical protein